MSEDTQKPVATSTPPHLGMLVRRLREHAGLTLKDLSEAVMLAAVTLRAIEAGKPAAQQTWRALLAHPAMRALPRLAQQQGFQIELVRPISTAPDDAG